MARDDYWADDLCDLLAHSHKMILAWTSWAWFTALILQTGRHKIPGGILPRKVAKEFYCSDQPRSHPFRQWNGLRNGWIRLHTKSHKVRNFFLQFSRKRLWAEWLRYLSALLHSIFQKDRKRKTSTFVCAMTARSWSLKHTVEFWSTAYLPVKHFWEMENWLKRFKIPRRLHFPEKNAIKNCKQKRLDCEGRACIKMTH